MKSKVITINGFPSTIIVLIFIFFVSQILHSHGILVLADGAHGPGQVKVKKLKKKNFIKNWLFGREF